jgi:hypothetical protein
MRLRPSSFCRPALAYQRGGNGAVWVHFTPRGRILKVAAMFYNPDFSSVATYRLPREY